MSSYFVDTSALVKRYVNEPGSSWVRSWIERPAENITVASELAVVEVYSALARRRRDGTLTPTSVLALQNDFLQHVEDEYIVITLESSILFRARQLVDQYPLRTLDAIHLSTAIHSISMLNEPMIFVTADARLLSAATAERFQVDNPYSH